MTALSEYRDRPHWSYSSLNQVLNICSLQFFFERIEKLPKPFTPVALAFGSVFHRVLEFVALNRMDGQVPPPEVTRDLFHDLWSREQEEGPPIEADEEEPDKLAEQGAGLVAVYLKQIDPEERVVGLNQAFAVPIGKSERPLIGEIDCVIEASSETLLIDWKTSARRWPKDQADRSLQPTAYLYAMSQLQPGSTDKLRYDVVVKNKAPVVEQHVTSRKPDDFQRLERLVQLADRIVEQQIFLPSDQSWACNGCPFREPCRAWHRNQATCRVRMAA